MTWNSAVLCEDPDLTAFERKMPELAQRFKGESGQSAYDGKRDLAKREIANRLRRMKIDPNSLSTDQLKALNKTAVCKELALIYWDLSDKNDTVSADQARRYEELYEESWVDVLLVLGCETSAGMTTIPLGRA